MWWPGTTSFSFAELRDATQALLAGAEMLAAGRDRTLSRLRTASGQAPGRSWPLWSTRPNGRRAIVGKPEPQIFRTALDRLGGGRTLVVGDRLDSDLEGAAAAGLDAAIVLTGVSTREQAEERDRARAGRDRRRSA